MPLKKLMLSKGTEPTLSSIWMPVVVWYLGQSVCPSIKKKTSIPFLPVNISNYSVSILSLKPLGNFACPKKNVVITFFLALKCCYML